MPTSIDPKDIQDTIRKRYAEVSETAEGQFAYPTGRAGAEALGYDPSVIGGAPSGLLESFCGVGNPFALGEIRSGEAVLDVGCGAGFDLFCASRLVGAGGKVCGIDLTPEMVAKANAHMAQADVANVDVRVAPAEDIPFDDNTFDVIISNGVLNMCPLKEPAYREIHRVLKAGGRLQLADMVLKADLPREEIESLDAWSQ